jgi:hypothetical protein
MDVGRYVFADTDGRAVEVMEMREIPVQRVGITLNRSSDDDIDEIASRQYVYGDGGEQDSYKIHEANIVAIIDSRFDYSRIRSVGIPS